MLKTIKLYGDLREITGHSELDAHVNSVGESIRFLLMNWPQLEAHMNTQHYQVLTDGNEMKEEEVHYPVAEEIKIVPVIAGAGGGAGKILAGAALIGLAMATGGSSLAFSGAGFGAAAKVKMTTSLALLQWQEILESVLCYMECQNFYSLFLNLKSLKTIKIHVFLLTLVERQTHLEQEQHIQLFMEK